jgi:hypothetical protein
MEVDVETNVRAEKFHDIFSSSTLPQVSCMSPAKVQAIHLLEGEWGKPGCTICWNFCIGKFAALIRKWSSNFVICYYHY